MSIKYLFLPLLIHLGGQAYAHENTPIHIQYITNIQTDTSWTNLINKSVNFHKKGNLASVTSSEFLDFYFTPDHRTSITKGGFAYAQYEEILHKYFRTWLQESFDKLTYSQEIYIHIPSFKNTLTEAFKKHEKYNEVKAFADIILEQSLMSLNLLGDKSVSLHIVLESMRAYINSGMYSLKEKETYSALKKSLTKANVNQLYNIISTEFNPFQKAVNESLLFAKNVDEIINFRSNYLNKAAEKAFDKWHKDFVQKASMSTTGVDIESFLSDIRALYDSSENEISKKYYSLFKEKLFSTILNTLSNTWAYNLNFYKELTNNNIQNLLNSNYFLAALKNNSGKENEIAETIEKTTNIILKTLEKNSFNLQAEQYQFAKVLGMENEKFNLSFLVNIRALKSEGDKISCSIINLVFNEKTIVFKDKTYKISVNFQPKLEDNSGTIFYQFNENDRVIASLPIAYKININNNFNINFITQIDEYNIIYKEQIANNNIFKELLENILFL